MTTGSSKKALVPRIALTVLYLDEIVDAFRTLGPTDRYIKTLEDVPNELDREEFLDFFGTKSNSNFLHFAQ